jgi:hypothetical protein
MLADPPRRGQLACTCLGREIRAPGGLESALVRFGVGPLIAGSVVEMSGLRWQAMIQGIAFISHQLGSFVGASGGYAWCITANLAANVADGSCVTSSAGPHGGA